jgi:hypothetical protein
MIVRYGPLPTLDIQGLVKRIQTLHENPLGAGPAAANPS